MVAVADSNLLKGKVGRFSIIDLRSHRLKRICRSSYASEAHGCEDGVDAADVVRGQLAEILGYVGVSSKQRRMGIEQVPFVAVVDARDAHDRVRSDVSPTAGAQKSLGFPFASLRQVFRGACSNLRWTHTENTLVDCMAKIMDADHLRRILRVGTWSFTHEAPMMKASSKHAKRDEKAAAAAKVAANVKVKLEALLLEAQAGAVPVAPLFSVWKRWSRSI